jgi:hypothetical protein
MVCFCLLLFYKNWYINEMTAVALKRVQHSCSPLLRSINDLICFLILSDLLHCTNEPNVSIPQLANLLIERSQNTNWVVVFKALITVHHMLCYGNEVSTLYFVCRNYACLRDLHYWCLQHEFTCAFFCYKKAGKCGYALLKGLLTIRHAATVVSFSVLTYMDFHNFNCNS